MGPGFANAENPEDAQRARTYGAEGIGLCRTEHMFFETRRLLPSLHKMIMSDLPIARREALDALLPFQRDDFAGLFRAMDGLLVITRLIDPPPPEFLPDHMALNHDLNDPAGQSRPRGSFQSFLRQCCRRAIASCGPPPVDYQVPEFGVIACQRYLFIHRKGAKNAKVENKMKPNFPSFKPSQLRRGDETKLKLSPYPDA